MINTQIGRETQNEIWIKDQMINIQIGRGPQAIKKEQRQTAQRAPAETMSLRNKSKGRQAVVYRGAPEHRIDCKGNRPRASRLQIAQHRSV